MKKLMLLIMLVLTSEITCGQHVVEQEELLILPSSQLVITGDTNLSKFECRFDMKFLQKKKVLKFRNDGNEYCFNDANLSLETRGFDCGSKMINRDFNQLIKSDQYPEINLGLRSVGLITPQSATATVAITIAGTQKQYKIPVEIQQEKTVRVSGQLDLNINDFKLEPPKKLFGMIVVKDDIQIRFDLEIQFNDIK